MRDFMVKSIRMCFLIIYIVICAVFVNNHVNIFVFELYIVFMSNLKYFSIFISLLIASHLSRIVFPFYEDGTAAPSGVKRPNPRELSNILTSGNSGLPSNDNKTAFFAFFGKFYLYFAFVILLRIYSN